MVKAVLLAALYPNVAVMDDEAAPGGRDVEGGRSVMQHVCGVCWHDAAPLPGRARLEGDTCGSQPASCMHAASRRARHSPPPGSVAAGKRPGWHDGAGEVAVHPSSICHMVEAQQYQRPYLVYLEKVPWYCSNLRGGAGAGTPVLRLSLDGAWLLAVDSCVC